MKEYRIECRENGDVIEVCNTKIEAERILDRYEDTDREDGTYTPNFYMIREV